MTLTADEQAWDDDDYEPPDPWEVGIDGSCCCEAMYANCDASDPWCTYHEEYREAVRYWNSRIPQPGRTGGGA